ncbi:MAG: DNA (cytosine-5-)-methyltransferase [Rhodocyclaceae bacterium]|nr:DNA (cytosine-5-)-methyltransferase [Rhodocyclaceae bacterium]MCA3025198.1 DNA (cytosine-5-)-methyltransferase [Rhodocyclaceae bacterium]MCA3033312.1 DNA (cytosine-5-)-methyltransferase [Rhodocyclaceae bacterium]MCA3036095.1 DNA (cytosine-5-)-methyltransferase [Rhodocyclaceae bacterium]MCA3040119.1 DNA (cytosine-5-)-methyltransferase [Rhodocyclaceae bacterium]
MAKQIRLFSSAVRNEKLSIQKQLLRRCIKNGTRLSDALEKQGWTYDDLQYETSNALPVEMTKYFTLADFQRKKNRVPVVSFFAGAGGLDLGLEASGFSHVALVEKNELFCNTLRFNRPKLKVIGPPLASGDVSETDSLVSQLEALIGAPPFDGVFVGGPPCQPFSIAANQRFSKSGDNFKRVGFSHATNGNLLFEYIALIKHFKPRAFLIENVPGLIDIDGGEQLQRAYRELESVGYNVHQPSVLIAAEYSVPQNRTRLFVVGNRTGASFVPPRPSGHQLACASVFNISLDGIANHETREHSAESVTRYMSLDFGERDQLGRVDRLDPSLPSKTVIAGGSAGGGRSHLHPYAPRTLSVRESARIQTFPDEYVFVGSSARQFTQVGNAVPPVLGVQLGNALYDSFFRKPRR